MGSNSWRFSGCGISLLLVLAGFTPRLFAAGTGDFSKQQPKYHIKEIPPAPVRTPEEELKTFKLPPGFHMELVASEPLLEKPIALTFDPDGRIYVVELRAYMPDMEGTGELNPIAQVSILEDTDGDGKLDKKTVFLDKLIVPRAVGLAGDGVLIAEPPNLWFCKDTNGDGKCDEKQAVFTDYGTRIENPEHMANGAMWSIDNWYYNANWAARFKYSKGAFQRDGTIARGQWGISQDDVGRLFYNSNSSMLRCDFAPAQYLMRNPYLANPAGLNAAIAPNAVFSSRVNPGVNRGYTEDCNLEGHLQRVTAACAPAIYRGDKFPEEFRGNAFVCEPAGNLVVRHVLAEDGIKIAGKSVQTDGLDFLTSTDERFRPVNLYTAPDGTLYLIDLYHGILQHKAYLSAYLADQVKKRDLDKGNNCGRLWRIVHDSAKPGPQPKLSKAPTEELVKNLSNPNGWWRDTAQRLLVERMDKKAMSMLEKVVSGEAPETTPLGKIHALWALQGMDRLRENIVVEAAKDSDPRVRLMAIRVGENMILKNTAPSALAAVIALAKDPDPKIQLQVLFMATPSLPELQAAASAILIRSLGDPIFRHAAMNGGVGRELELIQNLIADPAFAQAEKGQHEILNDLAECLVRGRSADRIEKLLDLIAAQPAGGNGKIFQAALLGGIVDATNADPKSKAPARKLRMPKEPPGIAALRSNHDAKIAGLAAKAESGMSWPGKPGDTTPPLKPLSTEQQKRYEAGQGFFTQYCAVCHQPSGLGQEGTAPPLVDSEWVLGTHERTVRIVLNGLHGPLKVGKRTIDMEMPGLGVLNDEQIASILTYIRREWGHESNPVEPENVAKIRAANAEHGDIQWTADELSKIK